MTRMNGIVCCLFVAVIAAGTACTASDDSSPPPTSSPCEPAVACDFARRVAEALSSRDSSRLVENFLATGVECPGRPGVDAPSTFCAGIADGTFLPGYRVANGSVVLPYREDQLVDRLSFGSGPGHADGYGGPEFALFTIGCPIADMSCESKFAFVVSGAGERLPDGRAVNVMFVERVEGSLKVVLTLSTQLPPVAGSDAVLVGGVPGSYPSGVTDYKFKRVR